jgi:hypothetical protein
MRIAGRDSSLERTEPEVGTEPKWGSLEAVVGSFRRLIPRIVRANSKELNFPEKTRSQAPMTPFPRPIGINLLYSDFAGTLMAHHFLFA